MLKYFFVFINRQLPVWVSAAFYGLVSHRHIEAQHYLSC